MRLSKAASILGTSTSTVHRLYQSLLGAGFVEQTEGHAYRLGPSVLAIAQRFLTSIDVRERARPTLEHLRDLTGETASLVIRRGQTRVCVDYALSAHEIAYLPKLGETLPITVGATGHAFLSALPKHKRIALLTDGDLAHSETQRPTSSLLKAIDDGVRRGYFASFSERIPGMNGIAIGLFDSRRTLLAAMNIVGPSNRWTAERITELGPAAVELVAQYAQHHTDALSTSLPSMPDAAPVDPLTTSSPEVSGTPQCGCDQDEVPTSGYVT
jgi:DNA-binding IclR family transcriptional regulator